MPTSDGKAVVWYQGRANPAWKQVEAVDRAAAYRFARELPTIWKKLTREFGPPVSDAGEQCYYGPDGRFDVYVDDSLVYLEGGYSRDKLGLAVPYPRAEADCSARPAWIAVKNDVSFWALAHEFMHALQFAHPTATCPSPPWWTEGQATWAADFVYPADNYEQRNFPQLVTDPVGYELSNSSYASWPFWMMLQRTLGIGVLRTILANLKTKDTVQAVDASIPGGFARQLPRFFLHAYNQSPVGDPGFPIATSFKAWDNWNATPPLTAVKVINLGGLQERTLFLRSEATSVPRLSFAGYQRVSIPDDKIKELTFTNALAGNPGGHVDALLHLVNGKWKLADWSKQTTITLCRDKPAENVRDVVIVNTNASLTAPLGSFTHKLRASRTCEPYPETYNAVFNVSYATTSSKGSYRVTGVYRRDRSDPRTVGALYKFKGTWSFLGETGTFSKCRYVYAPVAIPASPKGSFLTIGFGVIPNQVGYSAVVVIPTSARAIATITCPEGTTVAPTVIPWFLGTGSYPYKPGVLSGRSQRPANANGDTSSTLTWTLTPG